MISIKAKSFSDGSHVFIIFLTLLVASRIGADELPPQERDIRVTDATGQVKLKAADNSKKFIDVDGETPLSAGDIIETGPQSSAEISMDGETIFQLEAASRLTISKSFERDTQLVLSKGTMVAKVKPMTQPGQGMTIKLPTAVVAVRGTELAVDTGSGESHIGVFDEGHVMVSGAWGHERVMLNPNQETKVTLSNVPQPPQKLLHFRALRTHMPHMRSRIVFLRKSWTPMPVVQKHLMRQSLWSPNRPTSMGFRRPLPAKPYRNIKHFQKRKKKTHMRSGPSGPHS
jgi:hypothetical protein